VFLTVGLCNHHHKSAAKQASASFFQPLRILGQRNSTARVQHPSPSPSSCRTHCKHCVRGRPCTKTAHSFTGSPSGTQSTWPKKLSRRVPTLATSRTVPARLQMSSFETRPTRPISNTTPQQDAAKALIPALIPPSMSLAITYESLPQRRTATQKVPNTKQFDFNVNKLGGHFQRCPATRKQPRQEFYLFPGLQHRKPPRSLYSQSLRCARRHHHNTNHRHNTASSHIFSPGCTDDRT